MGKLFFYTGALYLLTSLFTSCQKDEAVINPPLVLSKSYANVDRELWSYFREFEEQGALRGFDIDLETFGITARIQELSENNVAGQCSYGSAIGSNIIIDQGFWDDFGSSYMREMVIFHELGHCYLHRDHREGAHSDGTCVSIMRSGLEACRDNYNSLSRDEYLDELFFFSD